MTPVYGTSRVKRRRRTNAELAEVDRAIVEAVAEDHPVSVRGVFYRVVSAGGVEKTEAGYDLIGRQLLKLRRSGAVPYSSVTDGTRLIRKSDSWGALDEMLEDAAAGYRRALWHDQNVEVMVFSEKDAISGILFPVTDSWDVPLCITRGYSSETFAHNVAEAVSDAGRVGKHVYLYQFGDHDPSGVNGWASFSTRVEAFVRANLGYSLAHYERLAVTPQQIEDLHLPTRPTKKSDSRAKEFRGESVEVDALPAKILRELADAAITKHIDVEALRITRVAERSERDILTIMSAAVVPEHEDD